MLNNGDFPEGTPQVKYWEHASRRVDAYDLLLWVMNKPAKRLVCGSLRANGVLRISCFGVYKFKSDYFLRLFTRLGTCRTCSFVRLRYSLGYKGINQFI